MLHVIDETILKGADKWTSVGSRANIDLGGGHNYQITKVGGKHKLTHSVSGVNLRSLGRFPTRKHAKAAADKHMWKVKDAKFGVKRSLYADLFKGSDDSRKWALTSSIWGRLSPQKKRQYVKLAKPRVEKKLGRKLKLSEMQHRPPQEFHDRIHHGYKPPWHGKQKSLESEFGPLVADVVKAFQAVLESETLEKGERPWSRDQHHSAARFHDSKADSFQRAAEKAGYTSGNRPTPPQGRLLRLSNQHNEAFHAHKDAAAERSAWRQKKLSGVARTMSAKVNKIKG